ncbi:MAG: response regulator, partial [Clostridiales bacterium]
MTSSRNASRENFIPLREFAQKPSCGAADLSLLKTILVVDGNPINRNILSQILSEKYIILEAENGQIALELLKKHHNRIAAVMLDLVMPVMDGYAMLEAIGKNYNYSNLPVVVTAVSGNDNERKALSFGAWDFVSKPYDGDIILFRLQNAIERSQFTALKQLKYFIRMPFVYCVF